MKISYLYKSLMAVTVVLCIGSSGSLWASTSPVSVTTQPTASVSNSCMVKSSDNVLFGNYLPSAATPLQASGQISLRCTRKAVVTLTPTSGGTTMTGGGGSLSYGLYADSSLSKKWGAGVMNTLPFDSTSSYNSYFQKRGGITLTRIATTSDLQAAFPDFNPNTFYYYQVTYSSNNNTYSTTIFMVF